MTIEIVSKRFGGTFPKHNALNLNLQSVLTH